MNSRTLLPRLAGILLCLTLSPMVHAGSGGCCFANGACNDGVPPDQCQAQGGIPLDGGCDSACTAAGACCLPDQSCEQRSQVICDAAGGVFRGQGVPCSASICSGACCLGTGDCQEDLPRDVCVQALNGVFVGVGSDCIDVFCIPFGACCLDGGACIDRTLFRQCVIIHNGTYRGDGSTCDLSCDVPLGACCLGDTGCQDFITETACNMIFGIYQGDGGSCDGQCSTPFGGCCMSDGTCLQPQTPNECDASGGRYVGDAQECVSAVDGESCVPFGACCVPDGSCIDAQTQVACDAEGGIYRGDAVLCSAVTCEAFSGCCFGDATCVNQLTAAACTAQGGLPQDDLCELIACDVFGACCLEDDCELTDPETCDKLEGGYRGVGTLCPQGCESPVRATSTEKGSLLLLSGLEVRFGGGAGPAGVGVILQDTFISLTNDYPEDVKVQMYLINGDPPLAADPATGERAHPGWNYIDNTITLTGDQPTYWSLLTGLPATGGVAPLTALDPGFPPGRPANDGTNDRVLRAYLIMWAVNDANQEIRWNHLKSEATVVDYARGCAWETGSINYPVVATGVVRGQATGTPGVLNLNGVEFAQSFAQLLLNFQAPGASAFSGPRQVISDTLLTLHPVGADLRQEGDGPITTKANFDVWNMNEVKFSEMHRCITCWDQTLLSRYDIPNNFLLAHLQTAHGKARIDGLASQLCNVDVLFDDGPCGVHPNDVCSVASPLTGVTARLLTYDGGMDHGAAGTNLIGLGLDDTAVIRYDVLAPPPEVVIPSTPSGLIDWLERELRAAP